MAGRMKIWRYIDLAKFVNMLATLPHRQIIMLGLRSPFSISPISMRLTPEIAPSFCRERPRRGASPGAPFRSDGRVEGRLQ
jgi:hypothetical protein